MLTASGVACSIVALRFIGVLQPLELATIDQGFRWRPPQPVDDRIVIVGITEQDIRSLNQWPLSDAKLAALLTTIQAQQPQSIGLDLYRDLQQAAGSQAINQIFQRNDNIFGIILLQASQGAPPYQPDDYIAVRPAATLAAKQQIGFNNTIQDTDQRVRRSLLYWQVPVAGVDTQGNPTTENKTYKSFALTLAQHYLAPLGIKAQAAPGHKSKVLQLGQAVLAPLQQSDGVYTRADTGGYQILANYRGPAGHFQQVSAMAVLSGQVPPDLFRDRIVLIGAVADSLKDKVATPFSTLAQDSPELMSGVELQANLISQLLTAATTGNGVFRTLPEGIEWVWIWVAAYWGTYISWRLRSRASQPYLSASVALA